MPNLYRKMMQRRWLWTLVFLLVASASMIGPTSAVSGLVSRSLNALFSIADYAGVVSDDRSAKSAPEPSRPARSSDFDASIAAGALSALPPDDGHGHEWTFESPVEQTTTTAQPDSDDDASSNVSGSGSSGGWSAGSTTPTASHRRAPASSEGIGGGFGGAAASPATSGRQLAESMPESTITVDELGDAGLPREVARGRSPESWLVDYGIQPDGDSDPPLLPEEKIGRELMDSAPKLIGGLSPLFPAAPLTPPSAPTQEGGPSADKTAPGGAPPVPESPTTGAAPELSPPAVVAPAAVQPDGAGGGDAASPVGRSTAGGDGAVPGGSNAPVQSFALIDVTAPDGGDGQVIAIVPEPVSLLLFGTSAAGWVIFTRLRGRRRTHKG